MHFLSGGTGKINKLFVTAATDVEPRQIFPSYSLEGRPVNKTSALAKIREKRAALKARETNTEDNF
jgi:hypothetical protein